MSGGGDVSPETSTRARSLTRSEWVADPRDYSFVAVHFSEHIYEMLSMIGNALEREVRGQAIDRRRLVTLTITVEAQVKEEQ